MENNIKNIGTTSTDSVTISRAQYDEFLSKQALLTKTESSLKEAQSSIDDLKSRVEWLEQVLRSAKKARFGSKSEHITADIIAGMDSLFDEAEAIQAVAEQEQKEEITIPEHKRRKRQSNDNIMANLPADTQIEVVEHYLDGNDTKCPQCDEEMEITGKKEYRSLVIIPKQVKVRLDVCYTYKCKHCSDTGDKEILVNTPRPKQVLPGSYATPEAIACLMVDKFVMGTPLYRMEQDFYRCHVPLSRQTMSNWMLSSTEKYLYPLYDVLHTRLVQHDVIHCDETTLQVLHEDNRRAESKSYMWVYRTGSCAEHHIVLFKYEPGRSGDYPKKFLDGYKGYLHSDGYEVYHNLGPDVVNVGCLVHARRRFYDIIKDKSGAVNQTAAKAVGYFTRIFNIEKRLTKCTDEERYTKRLELEKPILDELFAWAKTVKVTPKSKLGEAFGYLNKQEKYLRNYLLDGRLEPSNNLAERTVKPFVIDRKNFLFANTPKGANGSAVMFSIIETAKENKLDPYKYLTYIFTLAPTLDQSQPNWIEPLLPENAPEICRLNQKKK